MNYFLADKMDWKYCEGMLPKVSRTFALNIVQLKGDSYKAVTISYLLFRIADTFEDNLYQNEDEKIKVLIQLAKIFAGDKELNERLKLYEPLKFQWHEESDVKEVVENGDKVLKCYFDLPAKYRQIIDPLIVESVEGMIKFQKKKLESASKIFQLKDIKELEEYCYYVAGIVGVMLTRIFAMRKGIMPIKSELKKYEVQFGLALQLTNILKDWQKDLHRGWYFIPSSITHNKFKVNLNLSLNQQLDIIKELIPWVLTYFDASLKYIEIIPISEQSIRLFCIIPFVLAYHTLSHLIKMGVDKLSRQEVLRILEVAKDEAVSNNLLKENYLKLKEEIEGYL